MSLLCKLFGVTKQAYYKHDEISLLRKMAQEEFVVQYIHTIRKKDPGIGGMKLWYMYQREFGSNNPVGRDRFEDIVDKFALKVRQRTRKPRTTDSTHGFPTYPNLIKQLIPICPNQLWVSDITYIPVWINKSTYRFCYLSLVLDAYTEEIIGWNIGESLDTEHTTVALMMALERIGGTAEESLIHHSDRGCQYASKEYVSLLKKFHIKISMTENGNPKENPQAERINNTIKNELLMGLSFGGVEELRDTLPQAIEFYNYERPHMSINMMTPYQAAGYTGEITKKWTSYRNVAIKNKLRDEENTEISLPLLPCQRSPSELRSPVNL